MSEFGVSMNMSWKKISTVIAVVMISVVTASSSEDIRLVDGGNQYQGRVEILHKGQWGSVCDDNWHDLDCIVVCRQLKYGGGYAKKEAAFGEGTGKIWMDEVKCAGDENVLVDCLHNGWEVTDCQHSEDAGCICLPPALPSNGDQDPACDSSKHRITPFDTLVLSSGRAEVFQNGSWHAMCDDFWDDVDAAVFCSCLGYNNTTSMRAVWSPKLKNMAPNVEVIYDAVHCTDDDLRNKSSIWGCQHKLSEGICSAALESAAVSCQAETQSYVQVLPKTSLSCHGNNLITCFSNLTHHLTTDQFSMKDGCQNISVQASGSDVCVQIPMDVCLPADSKTDQFYKHYCYEVLYGIDPKAGPALVHSDVWQTRACCSLTKNGTATQDFKISLIAPSDHYTSTNLTFKMSCYLQSTFSGDPVAYPVHVNKGQHVYCKVATDTWDDKLYLVVPNCRFTGTSTGPPTFDFIDDKCPLEPALDVHTFNFDDHAWGFQFKVPKFQGYDQLYLICDSYVCDKSLDSKPLCDRTCDVTSSRRRKRDVSTPEIEVYGGPLIVHDIGEQKLNIINPEEELRLLDFEPARGSSGYTFRLDSQFRTPVLLTVLLVVQKYVHRIQFY